MVTVAKEGCDTSSYKLEDLTPQNTQGPCGSCNFCGHSWLLGMSHDNSCQGLSMQGATTSKLTPEAPVFHPVRGWKCLVSSRALSTGYSQVMVRLGRPSPSHFLLDVLARECSYFNIFDKGSVLPFALPPLKSHLSGDGHSPETDSSLIFD